MLFRRKVRKKKEAIEAANQALLSSGIFRKRVGSRRNLVAFLFFLGLQLEIFRMLQACS
jgi:hypothetical protein